MQRLNGLYKVPLVWNAWQGLNAESYREVCSKPRNAVVAAPVAHHATRGCQCVGQGPEDGCEARQQPAKSTSPVTDMRGNLFARERLKIERALRSLAGGLDYGDWIRVGMALKSTGANDALGLWIELFRHYPGYQQGECEAKWETFNGNVAGRVLWQRQPGRSAQARPELA